MFEKLKSLFSNQEKKEEEAPQVSDSAGQENFPDVAPVREIDYTKEA